MRFTWRARSSRPSPKSSTPALLLTQVRSRVPRAAMAAMRCSGRPHRPKPPTVSVAPWGMSATAAAAEGKTLSAAWRTAAAAERREAEARRAMGCR